MSKLCTQFDFKQQHSSTYYATTNRLVEAFNKTFCNIFKKIANRWKNGWHERMGKALWAYHIIHELKPNLIRLFIV